MWGRQPLSACVRWAVDRPGSCSTGGRYIAYIGASPGGLPGLPAGEATSSHQANTRPAGRHPQRPDSMQTIVVVCSPFIAALAVHVYWRCPNCHLHWSVQDLSILHNIIASAKRAAKRLAKRALLTNVYVYRNRANHTYRLTEMSGHAKAEPEIPWSNMWTTGMGGGILGWRVM